MKIKEILDEIKLDLLKKYNYSPEDFIEENLQETYIMLGELLNPSNAYEYSQIAKGLWQYGDSNGNKIFVRLVFQPISDDNEYFEFKTWWTTETGKKIYDEVPKGSSAIDWDKRTDTVAKIFQDEALPLFINQNRTDKLCFVPVTRSRYVFALRMIRKFIPKSWEIVEEFPKKITIIKK